MNALQIFQYNGSAISFQKGDSVMVNATEMAKPFGKRPIDWLKNQQTEDFLNELSKVRKITLADLVVVSRGGDNGGTWFHEDVALEFSRWLSPAFSIWCNDRIKELLTTGVTTVSNDDEAIAYAMNVLQKRLESVKAEKRLLEHQNAQKDETIALQSAELKEAAPKVEYYDEALSANGTYTTMQIAKEFGIGAVTLNQKLRNMGVQYKQNGQWLLYAKYSGKGYTKSITRTYTRSDGSAGSQLQTVWTEKGREFIHSLFHEKAAV